MGGTTGIDDQKRVPCPFFRRPSEPGKQPSELLPTSSAPWKPPDEDSELSRSYLAGTLASTLRWACWCGTTRTCSIQWRPRPSGQRSRRGPFTNSKNKRCCHYDLERPAELCLLSEGLIEHSDYSGILAEREAKRLLFQVLDEDCGLCIPYQFTKSCDIDGIGPPG